MKTKYDQINYIIQLLLSRKKKARIIAKRILDDTQSPHWIYRGIIPGVSESNLCYRINIAGGDHNEQLKWC